MRTFDIFLYVFAGMGFALFMFGFLYFWYYFFVEVNKFIQKYKYISEPIEDEEKYI